MTRPSPLRPLILWGATGQARVLAEFLPAQGWKLIALFDNNPQIVSPFPDVPLFPGEIAFPEWLARQASPPAALVAIGGDRGNERLKLQRWLENQGCSLPVAVHPTAYVAASVRVGPGSQILAGAIIGADVQIAQGVIINTSASIDHECCLGSGAHIGPGAVLCGLVYVGEGTLVGAGSTLLPRVKIGRDSIIGAGAVVTDSLPDNVIAYGNPARIIRPRFETNRNEST